jgi:hypothetical protein
MLKHSFTFNRLVVGFGFHPVLSSSFGFEFIFKNLNQQSKYLVIKTRTNQKSKLANIGLY